MKSFFLFSGVLLMASGILQVFVRPRANKENLLTRIVNRSTVRAVVFVLVGAVGVLVGTGMVPTQIP
ncbi:MAG: hypothetical protein SGI86_06820 [Deltaproteobacteria bacterium]|nr:hypothetical protein [Deltaproteobacteria bacterium]